MNDNLIDYTNSMGTVIYKGYVRSLLLFVILVLIFIAFLFRASPRAAILLAVIPTILFLIIFPGVII